MKLNDMFPSQYIKSGDFEEDEVKILTIRDVDMTEMKKQDGKTEQKPVISWKEKEVKPFVCNKTNAVIIAKLYGDDTDDWLGKRVALFVTQIDAFGEQQDAIRVRAKVPSAAVKAPARRVIEEPETEEGGSEELPFDNEEQLRAAQDAKPPIEQKPQPAQVTPPPGYVSPPEQVHVPSTEKNGNGTKDKPKTQPRPSIRTAFWEKNIVSEAHDRGWELDDKGKVNPFRLLNAIVDGGFVETEITDKNWAQARQAMVNHYQAIEEDAVTEALAA